MKYLFFFIISFSYMQLGRAVDDACLTPEAISLQNSSLQDILKVTQTVDPKIQLCWFRHACQNYTYSKDKSFPLEVPAGSSCLEYQNFYEEEYKNNCGLSLNEMAAIKDYSGSMYGCMNSYLRQTTHKSPALDAYIKLLNDALDKLPSYEGIVVRGADLPENIAALHKKGNTVIYDAFTSTSTGRVPWGSDVFIIISKTGKPIMGMSHHEGENEVLFKSGTRFEVLDQYKEGNSNFYVMKEVTEVPSSEEEKKSDLALVQKMKENRNNGSVDRWSCTGPDMPKNIKQKHFPNYSSPNVYGNYGPQDWYELKDGVLHECYMDDSSAQCDPIIPGETHEFEAGDQTQWMATDKKDNSFHECSLKDNKISCTPYVAKTYSFEFKQVQDGVFKNCKYVGGKLECSEMDMKKAPGEGEPTAFYAGNPTSSEYQKCTWTENAYKCEKVDMGVGMGGGYAGGGYAGGGYAGGGYSYNTESKIIEDGVLKKCTYNGGNMNCQEVDKKAASNEDQGMWFAFDKTENNWKQCKWEGMAHKCDKIDFSNSNGYFGTSAGSGSGMGDWQSCVPNNGKMECTKTDSSNLLLPNK